MKNESISAYLPPKAKLTIAVKVWPKGSNSNTVDMISERGHELNYNDATEQCQQTQNKLKSISRFTRIGVVNY